MRRGAAFLFVAGILFSIGWQNGWFAPTEIQYATTTTSTWKKVGVAPAGDNSFTSPAASNALTRGRYYYFRMRHLKPDNTALTPWSRKIGAVWLTGAWPEDNTFLIQKTDNAIISFPGGKN